MLQERYALAELIKLIIELDNCSLSNPTRNNELFDQVVLTFSRLHRDPAIREQLLRPLMMHQHPAIRCTAGAWLLWDYPVEAENVLSALAQQSDMIGFEAKTTLQEWKTGELKRPF